MTLVIVFGLRIFEEYVEKIDNTALAPDVVARQIAAHLSLTRD